MENNQLDYKSSFKVVLDSFLTALKYLFKNVKNFATYLQFYFIQLFATLLFPLAPLACKANYGVVEKIMNNEEYELLSQYKGINGLKRYARFYLLQVVQGVFMTGFVVAVLVVLAPVMLLITTQDTVVLVSIIVALCSTLAVLVVTSLMYSANYVYVNEDLGLADIISKSIENGKHKVKEIVLSNVLLYVLMVILFIIPTVLVITGVNEFETILVGIGSVLGIALLPVIDLTSKLVQIQLIKQASKKEVE